MSLDTPLSAFLSINAATLGQAALRHVRAGDAAKLAQAIARGADLSERDPQGRNLLHLAATRGSLDCARAAILAGCKRFREIAGIDRQTPLHLAARHGRLEMCELFLLHGAPFGALDRNGRPPLHLAAMHGAADCARLLARPRQARLVDRDGQAPLSLALRAQIRSAVGPLLSATPLDRYAPGGAPPGSAEQRAMAAAAPEDRALVLSACLAAFESREMALASSAPRHAAPARRSRSL